MIEFNYGTDFRLDDEEKFADWISRVVASEEGSLAQLNYIFCSDQYLLQLNRKHLNHDTLTDILTFDYSERKHIGGDIFISVERVAENAAKFTVTMENELLRVMVHGVLHLLGYSDKSEVDKIVMRRKEDEKMKLFHVEQ